MSRWTSQYKHTFYSSWIWNLIRPFIYIQKLYQYHGLDISKTLPDRFITLSISNSSFSDEEIRAKYGEKLSAHLLELCESLESMTNDNHSPSFSIKIKHELQLTKSKVGLLQNYQMWIAHFLIMLRPSLIKSVSSF